MTREEALTVVETIVNSWPGAAWDVGRLDAYARAIEPLDAGVTLRAVHAAVKELKYRPSVAELIEFVRRERRLSEPDEARFITPEKLPRPEWVERWGRARAAGDMRPFPEQLTALDSLARQTPENYRAYAPPEHPISDREHWIQPDEYLAGDASVEAL